MGNVVGMDGVGKLGFEDGVGSVGSGGFVVGIDGLAGSVGLLCGLTGTVTRRTSLCALQPHRRAADCAPGAMSPRSITFLTAT